MRQNIGGLDRGRRIAGLRQCQRLFHVGLSARQTAGIGQSLCQVGQRRGQLAIVNGPRVAANGHRLFEQRYGAIVQSLSAVGETDTFQQLGADFRLQNQVVFDFFGALVQQILGGRFLALGVEGVGLRKDVDHERRNLLRPIPLEGRRIAREQNAVVLPKRDAGDQRQADEHRARRDRRQQIPAQELGRVVAPIALARSHRLAEQMPAQIVGERLDR